MLVEVRARDGVPCRGEMGDNAAALQALWVFSADACGVYEIEGLTIAHAGRTKPVGIIELENKHGDTKVGSGSGILLRVIAQSG